MDNASIVDTVYLVACVAEKREEPAPAADLYISPWFKEGRRIVENSGMPWFILSAKYHLTRPSKVIKPYNKTLSKRPRVVRPFDTTDYMTDDERRDWAAKVIRQLKRNLPASMRIRRIVILAGQRYREFLMDYLNTRAVEKPTIPLEHVTQFKQYPWLRDRGKHLTIFDGRVSFRPYCLLVATISPPLPSG